MLTREDLIAQFDLIEQHVFTDSQRRELSQMRSAHLMFDANDPVRPTPDDLQMAQDWVDRWKAGAVAQQEAIGTVLGELGL